MSARVRQCASVMIAISATFLREEEEEEEEEEKEEEERGYSRGGG